MEAIQEDVTRFVFVDETSTTLTYCCSYARAPPATNAGPLKPFRLALPIVVFRSYLLCDP